MSAYLVFNYSITDAEGYQAYPPAAMPTMGVQRCGGPRRRLHVRGRGRHAGSTIVLRFDSKDAARAWYESDAYHLIKHHRTDNTNSVVVLCDGFVMPI